MKEHWSERLLKVEDLDERRLLRGVLLAAFSNIEDYTNNQLEAIKERVFEESKLDYNLFDIYTSVVSANDYDPINDFLFPMNMEDLKELPFDAAVITEVNEAGEKPILGKLYFELDYLELLEIEKALFGRTFKGQLKTSVAAYDIEVSLVPYMGYIKQIEKLYELYLENNVPWRTILHPSIYKFMEIRLETEIQFKKQEKIEEITINLEELDVYKQINQIPLWNIKTKALNNKGFANPAIDRINYMHTFQFETGIRKRGYLFDSNSEFDDIINIENTVDEIILTSSKAVISQWKLWEIVHPIEKDLNTSNLISNRKIESFIDNFASRFSHIVRTTAEIHRLANLFVDASDLKLIDIEVDVESNTAYETYALNSFVKDEIRIDEAKRIMKLKFTTGEITPFTRDIMSFLTSEINLYFPECRCVGELI